MRDAGTELRRVLGQMFNAPQLPLEEELELGRRAAAGDVTALKKLVSGNVRHIATMARMHARRGVSIEEAVSAASLALMRAARAYDPSLGYRFSTYCGKAIHHEIMALLEERAATNAGARNGRRIVALKIQAALHKLGRQPSTDPATVTAVERATGLRRGLVESTLDRMCVGFVPLDATYDGSSLHEVVPSNEETPEQAVERAEHLHVHAAKLRAALARLPAREREVIERLHLADEPETQAEVGRAWGVTRERVRQIEARAMSRLCRLMGRPRQETAEDRRIRKALAVEATRETVRERLEAFGEESITSIERAILEDRVEAKTHAAIARERGISRARVQWIERRAMNKLAAAALSAVPAELVRHSAP